MAVRKSHNILALVTQGFSEFTHTTVTSLRGYVSRVPILQKSVVVGSLVFSTLLLVIFRPIRRKMEVINLSKEGYLQKIKKWTLVKMSFSAIGAILGTVEYLISPSYNELTKEKQSPKTASPEGRGARMDSSMFAVPAEMNGLPKLLNLRHMPSSSLAGGTPNNNCKPSEGDGENWTPFSSVSGIDESVFDRSCVSLMDDLSQSTVSTPIRDIRQQMASKIRTWRLAIRDLEGTPEFPSWSPDSNSRRSKRSSNWISRVWFSLTDWLPFGSSSSPIPTSAQRKRKRLEGDDDDELALYIPHHKDKPKDKDLKLAEPTPGIRGLSVVPIIGNWFSSEASAKDIFPTQQKEADKELDHIALIQRDNCCDVPPQNGKDKSEVLSDSEPYEILDAETQVVVEVHPSKEQNTSSSKSESD